MKKIIFIFALITSLRSQATAAPHSSLPPEMKECGLILTPAVPVSGYPASTMLSSKKNGSRPEQHPASDPMAEEIRAELAKKGWTLIDQNSLDWKWKTLTHSACRAEKMAFENFDSNFGTIKSNWEKEIQAAEHLRDTEHQQLFDKWNREGSEPSAAEFARLKANEVRVEKLKEKKPDADFEKLSDAYYQCRLLASHNENHELLKRFDKLYYVENEIKYFERSYYPQAKELVSNLIRVKSLPTGLRSMKIVKTAKSDAAGSIMNRLRYHDPKVQKKKNAEQAKILKNFFEDICLRQFPDQQNSTEKERDSSCGWLYLTSSMELANLQKLERSLPACR